MPHNYYNIKMAKELRTITLTIIFLAMTPLVYSQNEMPQKSDSIARIGNSEYYIHTVKKGETSYSLSKTYEISLETLYENNPNAASGLRLGEMLRIPVVSTKKSETPQNYHVVKQGETVYSIARNYSIPIDSLLSNNKKIVNNHIVIGDTLVIPSCKNIYDFIEYRTDKKESLADIANRFHISLKELKQRNPRLGNNVAKNTVVFIPVQKKTSGMFTNPEKSDQQETVSDGSSDLPQPKNSDCIGEWDTKKKYTVALILPFSAKLSSSLLSGNKKNTNPNSASTSIKYISFYQGVVLALDSLADKGLNVRLNVYDVNNELEMGQLLEKPEMQTTDLIIGIIYVNAVKKIADFSKQHHIPFINVASSRNDILEGYPNVAKITPDENAVSLAAQRIVPENVNANILIIRKNETSHTKNVEQLKTLYPHYKEFLSEGKNMSGAVSSLDSHKPNFVFMFSENTTEILDVMRVFDEKRKQHDVTLVGYPNWNTVEKLDFHYAHDLKLHFVVPQLVDHSEQRSQDFISTFRTRFNNDPNVLAFQGYDIAYHFIYALGMFGHDCFECFNHIPHQFLSTGEIIFSNTPGNGYNNQYWDIYTIKDYEIVRIP